jgi:hypothetical protein
METNQEVEEEEEKIEEEEVIAPVDPVAESSLEFIRSAKIKELSRACNKAIESGFDVSLSDGQVHSFSLT